MDLFGEQNSLFSEEQLEEISIKIKRYSDEEIIQDAYDYFKSTGFPWASRHMRTGVFGRKRPS